MRKIVLRPILLIILFFAILVSLVLDSYGAEQVKARVALVVNGDTFVAHSGNNDDMQVRLYGIDAPELRQSYGEEAKAHLAQLLGTQAISLELLDVNRYGQHMALAYLEDGSLVQEKLLEEGYAWVYPQYCMIPVCRYWAKVEIEARDSRLGLWQEPAPRQPWRWREQNVRK